MNEPGNCICTIVAKNYIALARTLCQSYLDHHPDSECYVLIVDETHGFIESSTEKFTLITLDQLEIPKIENMAMKYNITEFSTSVKPFFMEFLMGQYNLDRLIYLDPDILVCASLEALFLELDHSDILLTPHLDTDYPDDGLIPNDSHIMRSGIFNLGFIGVRNSSNGLGFLRWWQIKLGDRCLNDPWLGYMVDQKFLDYAYVLFSNVKIIKDTSYNTAYWNIHSRKIENRGGVWLCNGDPLRFFHFSNYKPENPGKISGHQTRFTFEQRPDLQEIFNHYYKLLMSNGYEETSQWQYTWGQFENGKKINQTVRTVFRLNFANYEIKNPFDYNGYPFSLKIKILKRRIINALSVRINGFLSKISV